MTSSWNSNQRPQAQLQSSYIIRVEGLSVYDHVFIQGGVRDERLQDFGLWRSKAKGRGV